MKFELWNFRCQLVYPEEKQGGCKTCTQKSLLEPLSAQRHTLVVRGDWARGCFCWWTLPVSQETQDWTRAATAQWGFPSLSPFPNLCSLSLQSLSLSAPGLSGTTARPALSPGTALLGRILMQRVLHSPPPHRGGTLQLAQQHGPPCPEGPLGLRPAGLLFCHLPALAWFLGLPAH